MNGKANAVTLGVVVALAVAAAAGAAVVRGTPADDRLHGTARPDLISGEAGNDVIHGGPGSDVELGGDGNDTLYGGRGADQLHGGPGDDTLFALANDNRRDLVDCGAGDDTANLNVRERGLYRVVGCEHVNWVVPTPEQLA